MAACPAGRSTVRAGGWADDKRQGHGTCRFADGSKFSGQWEADAWVQSLADAAKSKLGGAGLVKAAAGSNATFSIKVHAQLCRWVLKCRCMKHSSDCAAQQPCKTTRPVMLMYLAKFHVGRLCRPS